MSFAQVVGRVGVPAVLVSPACRGRVAAAAAALPAGVSHYFGFETRTGRPDAESDFALNLSPAGLRWLAAGGGRWPRLAAFARVWGETADPPFTDAGAVWLEFDTSAGGGDPSVFFALLNAAALRPGDDGPRAFDWACAEAVPALRGSPLPAKVADALARCAAAFPPGLDRLQIGLMLARPVDAVRVCAFGLTADAVPPLLRRAGWPGDLAELTRVVDRYAPFADTLCLHLDVGAAVWPTVGVELLYRGADPWDWQPPREPRWHGLFERLVADGYCRPDKHDALLAWPGRTPYRAALVDRLIAAAAGPAEEPPADGELVTGLQHVKLSAGRGGFEFKAYFGCRHDPGGNP